MAPISEDERKERATVATLYQRDRRKRAVAVGNCSICCTDPARAGMKTCQKCADRALTYERPKAPQPRKRRPLRTPPNCKVCEKPARPARRGLCGTCYNRALYQLGKRNAAADSAVA